MEDNHHNLWDEAEDFPYYYRAGATADSPGGEGSQQLLRQSADYFAEVHALGGIEVSSLPVPLSPPFGIPVVVCTECVARIAVASLTSNSLPAQQSAGLRQDFFQEAEAGVLAQLTPAARARFAKSLQGAPAAEEQAPRRSTHRKLKVIAGSAQHVRLRAPTDQATRPMMEKVRGAVFSMLLARLGRGGAGWLEPRARWLDLYAGTGSIGIEAASRGAGEAHFVELDPWCIQR